MWPTLAWGFIVPVVVSIVGAGLRGSLRPAARRGAVVTGLAHCWLLRCCLMLTPDSRLALLLPPRAAAVFRVPVRTSSAHLFSLLLYYYSTTRTVRSFTSAPRRTTRPWATDNRPTLLPPPSLVTLAAPVNGLRTPPSDKRHSSLRPSVIPLQNLKRKIMYLMAYKQHLFDLTIMMYFYLIQILWYSSLI